MASYLLWTNINRNTTDTEHLTESETSIDNTAFLPVEENTDEQNTDEQNTRYPVEQTADGSLARDSPDEDSSASASGGDSNGITGEAEIDDRVEELELLTKTPINEFRCLHEGSSELSWLYDPAVDTCDDMTLTTPPE